MHAVSTNLIPDVLAQILLNAVENLHGTNRTF